MTRIGLAVVIVVVVVGVSAAPTPANDSITCADLDPFAAVADELGSQWPAQRITASVYDTRTGCAHDLAPDVSVTTASVVKVEIMAGILLRAQDAGRELTTHERALIGPMITHSADAPASSLWLGLGGQPGMSALDQRLGLHATRAAVPWGATATTARDQVWLLRQLLLGHDDLFLPASRQTARSYMESVVPDQQWGVTAGLPAGWKHPMKNGFFPLTGRGWRINSVGFVEDPTGGGYVVAILSDGWATESQGIQAVEHLASTINAVLAHEGLSLVWDGRFRDDDGSVHEAAIERLAAAGITTGCRDDPNLFCPHEAVTRGQMASFLVRALGWPEVAVATFSDTSASPHAGAIEALAAQGIVVGCENGRYCPADPVTRGQMATLLARALGWDAAAPSRFVDVHGSVHAGAVEALAVRGITHGCDQTGVRYCPRDEVTRAQMASFLVRAFGLEE